MFRDISPEMSGLISNYCAAILYGVVVVTYLVCSHVLIQRRHDRSTSATCVLLGTSTIQFILSTIHIAFSIRLLIEGFINTENIPNGGFLYWINPATKAQVITKAVYVTNSVLGDAILIWRVYMVWGKNAYVCLPPVLITCATSVTGYIAVARLSQITGNLQPQSLFEILNWILATWTLSIATQLICTGLIAGKIWWHARKNPVAKSRYLSIIAIIAESGAVYTLSTAFLLSFADLKTQAGAILGDMTTQIATIVPIVIIIRVELSRTRALQATRKSEREQHNQMAFEPVIYTIGSHKPEASGATESTLNGSVSLTEVKYVC